MRGSVFVFAKAPRAGAVKTRLGAEIGMGRAAALFRIMTDRAIMEACKGDWRTIIAVDRADALAGRGDYWRKDLPRVLQGSGDLGARMRRVFDRAPPGPVVIVGADAPGMRARHLRAAFRELGRSDAVFGPARDGGYWLIGHARRRSAPDLFKDVRWSTGHALADTRASLPRRFQVAELELLADIDEPPDLHNLGLRAAAR